MSRTKRKIWKWNRNTDKLYLEKGGDGQVKNKRHIRHKKMDPYIKSKGSGKFFADRHEGIPGFSKGVSKYDKLITKNANRSKKKALRQALKLDVKKKLENAEFHGGETN